MDCQRITFFPLYSSTNSFSIIKIERKENDCLGTDFNYREVLLRRTKFYRLLGPVHTNAFSKTAVTCLWKVRAYGFYSRVETYRKTNE